MTHDQFWRALRRKTREGSKLFEAIYTANHFGAPKSGAVERCLREAGLAVADAARDLERAQRLLPPRTQLVGRRTPPSRRVKVER